MRLSRPNGVTYHGTPAYGTRPWAVSVSSMLRSTSERATSALKLS